MAAFLLVLGIIGAFWVPPAKNFQEPQLARIVFFHLPNAIVGAALLFVASFWAYKWLQKPDRRFDVRLGASWELAAVFSVLTLVTGILFSRVQWGAWWQWDPRQTSYLFVTLFLCAGLALRAGIADEMKRATASAGYALLMLVPMTFLIFVYPRLPHVRQQSFHPSTVIAEGGFDSNYRTVLYTVFVGLVALTVMLWKDRVMAGELELALETEDHGMDTDRGGAAPARLVQPVGVSRSQSASHPGSTGEAQDERGAD